MKEIAFKKLMPALVTAGVVLVAMWVASWLLSRGIARIAQALKGRSQDQDHWREVEQAAASLNRFMRRIVQLMALLIAGVVILEGLGFRGVPRLTSEEIVKWLVGPGFRIAVIGIGALGLTRAIHFLAEGLQNRLVGAGASVDVLERRKRVQTLARLMALTSDVLIMSIAVLMILRQVDVDITPILTGAGIVGLAVGFGAQNLVRDVISGFFIILENQVRVGDVASINGKSGLVEAIRLRTIVLRSLDGTVHVIPNGAITELSNMTKDFSYAVIDVGIAYKEDVDRVMAVLRGIGEGLQADAAWAPVILDALEVLGIDSFGDSAVVVRTRMKTMPSQQWAVGRELRRRIKRVFDEQQIEIPFPHLSLYAGEASKAFRVEGADGELGQGQGARNEGQRG
ncbi:MAG: mechanosensitive ion channel family protein [Acidobacteriota bacterium]|nr:mechanosensitive ion channel family protein [Acidobacteriota bacterium]